MWVPTVVHLSQRIELTLLAPQDRQSADQRAHDPTGGLTHTEIAILIAVISAGIPTLSSYVTGRPLDLNSCCCLSLFYPSSVVTLHSPL